MSLPFEPLSPVIRLRNSFNRPYDDAIAAARTCYSSDVVEAVDVTAKQRDSIGPLTFNAGHHTIYQHATFEFSLENISRHFVWSILHSFPFYNSDQQSQRYVRLNEVRAFLPPPEKMTGKAFQLYRSAVVEGFQTYRELAEILKADTLRIMGKIRHLDRHPHPRLEKQVVREADKKAIEIARYVLPVATHTAMVYTCSGLVLHRLWRLMNGGDTPTEARTVIGAMVQAVKEIDPDFFSKIGDPPLEREEIPESSWVDAGPADYDPAEWDRELAPYRLSKLMDYTANGEKVIAQSMRMALGSAVTSRSSSDLVRLALDPHVNRYRIEKIDLSAQSPVMRTLHHVYYTFQKRLSHSADSQNQRHRMVPGTRPLYQLVDTARPDFFRPMLIERNPKALEMYDRHMKKIWKAKNDLLEMGVPREFAVYVLPNAANVRFMESGSLLFLLHKWTQRTCLNAQEEIFHASMEEVEQVTKVHPFLKDFVGPPCVVRNGVASPRCTEGSHFCGIPVWRDFPNVQREL
ncbi:MAG TPA: FAD-dependent thymidylate synthase [Bdellovibrionota bacterium]|nr:FAD-dependent thymidylate synthase [Bdellovibrionota bacterium]